MPTDSMPPDSTTPGPARLVLEVPARLVLEDGTILRGVGFGAVSPGRSVTGEVVFNTAMCGYQEALTDPSYSGQILTMTASMMGNYGVVGADVESNRPQVSGFVIRELARRYSNHRADQGLDAWLAGHGILGIAGVDTRALVRKLRIDGALRGVISTETERSDASLVEMARSAPSMAGRNLACAASVTEARDWTEDLGSWRTGPGRTPGAPAPRVLALDCGGKHSIYRHLADLGCRVRVVPHDLDAAAIREAAPDGLFVSNGPGDPEVVERTIETLRSIAGEIPTFGICLGHQLLALALGATTFKLKFGHRGANQPVRNLLTGTVEITSQNHGFCVHPASLADAGCEITHVHLNDDTLAGFRHVEKPLFCVQYHPEASPGPHDSAYLFDCFVRMMQTRRPVDAATMLEAQARRRRHPAAV